MTIQATAPMATRRMRPLSSCKCMKNQKMSAAFCKRNGEAGNDAERTGQHKTGADRNDEKADER